MILVALGYFWKITATHDKFFTLLGLICFLGLKDFAYVLSPTIAYEAYHLLSRGVLNPISQRAEEIALSVLQPSERISAKYVLRALYLNLWCCVLYCRLQDYLEQKITIGLVVTALTMIVSYMTVLFGQLGVRGLRQLMQLDPLVFPVVLSDGTRIEVPFGPPSQQNGEIVYYHTQDIPIPLDSNHNVSIKVFHGTVRIELGGQELDRQMRPGSHTIIGALPVGTRSKVFLRLDGKPAVIVMRGVHASPAAAARCGCELQTGQVAGTA
ncbi:MAG: hypothetical protein CMP20_01605 [Rickettsiales bacterium]|nr:hypothetical protein [Rickettsiales bacterium]